MEARTSRLLRQASAATNQAYAVTGLVEEQFSTVMLTVKELRLLASREVGDQFQPLEDVVG